MSKKSIALHLLIVLSPIWLLYIYGYISTFGLFDNDSSYGPFNAIASAVLWAVFAFIAAVCATRLTNAYQQAEKVRKAKEAKLLALIEKG